MTSPLEVRLVATDGVSSNTKPAINVVRFRNPLLEHGLTYEVQVRNDPQA